MIKAGTGTTIITPPLGTSLQGSFEDRPAHSVTDELHVRALVLDDGDARVALVLCDIIVLGAETVNDAKSRIEAATGIPASHVMISATHTHTAAAAVPLLATDPDPVYIAWLPGRIADAVSIAVRDLTPASIAIGKTDVDGICFNRRYRMTDGTVVFNPGIRNPEIVETVGPTDPEVTAMLVRGDDDEPIALWSNLSLHYVGTDDALSISADYYGHFAEFVGRALGPTCIGMLTNGTSGDINNVDVSGATAGTPPGQRSRQVAGAVGGASIAATLMLPGTTQLRLGAELIPFDVVRRPVTDDDVALATDILASADIPSPEVSLGFSFVTGQPIPSSQIPTYAMETIELQKMPTSHETVLQIIHIGDFAIVGLPGEVFVEFGLHIKKHAGRPVAVVSLANDYVGYLPTRRAFNDGAYETWAARSAWPAAGTGEAMVDAVLSTLNDGAHT